MRRETCQTIKVLPQQRHAISRSVIHQRCDRVITEQHLKCTSVAIAAVPPGYARLQLDALDDGIWGADGFDM